MKRILKRFSNSAGGATAIEYALIAGLIAIALLSGLRLVSTNNGAEYNNISSAYPH